MAASPTWDALVELDQLTVKLLVDNETDSLSTACSCCSGSEVLDPLCCYTPESITNIKRNTYFSISTMCYAGHGLSLLLQARSNDKTHTLLFDAGPSAHLWSVNAERMGVKQDSIEAAVLSHWHCDHSGGLPAVVASNKGLILDLHPDKNIQRGLKHAGGVFPIQKDPSLDSLRCNESVLEFNSQPHTLLDDYFYVSGFIPRVTSYETGMELHVKMQEDGSWVPDPLITEERYLAVKVKGRGVVVFSGCSHAGIVNVMRDVKSSSGCNPAVVVGGLHLSTKDCEGRIDVTMSDIRDMSPSLVLAGHCTGWRAKTALATVLAGRFMPCSVGATYEFHAAKAEAKPTAA